MKAAAALAAALAVTATAAVAQNDMKAFASRIKPGLYEYKMEMDMGAIPGAPKGMGKQTMTVQHCLTAKDIEDGQLGRKDPNSKVDCKITDMKVSGNTANYKFACKGDMQMTSDNTVTFVPDGYKMVSKMSMNAGGQAMNMTHNSQAKYLGACK
ncbi:MAG: DUF3617 family protein [Burkholderiales bacterium]|nr:DUF3617 family protein [Burkholderiales bacterium]